MSVRLRVLEEKPVGFFEVIRSFEDESVTESCFREGSMKGTSFVPKLTAKTLADA